VLRTRPRDHPPVGRAAMNKFELTIADVGNIVRHLRMSPSEEPVAVVVYDPITDTYFIRWVYPRAAAQVGRRSRWGRLHEDPGQGGRHAAGIDRFPQGYGEAHRPLARRNRSAGRRRGVRRGRPGVTIGRTRDAGPGVDRSRPGRHGLTMDASATAGVVLTEQRSLRATEFAWLGMCGVQTMLLEAAP
jgi:hypothetical protein